MRDCLFAAVGGGASLAAARAALGAAHPGGRADGPPRGETARGVAFDGIAVSKTGSCAAPPLRRSKGPGGGETGGGETDPLGYSAFFARRGDGLVVAGDRVEQVARRAGGRVERAVAVHGRFTLQGSAMGRPSAHRGISLPPRPARAARWTRRAARRCTGARSPASSKQTGPCPR